MPEQLRPDRVGWVVDENIDLIKILGVEHAAAQIWVAPGHEEDYLREPAWSVIWSLCSGNAIVDTGKKRNLPVLWRIPPGTHARVMTIAEGDKFVISDLVRFNYETLGPDIERSKRVGELLRQSDAR